MKRVIVFQTWGIGDMIMSTPMLSALRQKLPKVNITVVAGSHSASEVIEGSAFCDEVRIMSPGKMGIFRLIRVFSGFRKERFDAAIICTRISPRLAQMLKLLSGIKIIAGDSLPPRRWGYTHWIPVKSDLHRVESNINILKMIFPEARSSRIYFHLDQESRIQADQFWDQSGIDGKNVLGIHPGGGFQQKNKLFPAEKFYIVIKMFLEKFSDARVIIFFGPEDLDIIPFFSGIDKRLIFITNFSLRVVGALISRIRVLLSNDSGLGHVAAAMGVPVVTLAGPTNVSSTRPWGNDNIIVRTTENLKCIPCYGTSLYGNCDHLKCMKSISEKDILEKLSRYFVGVK